MISALTQRIKNTVDICRLFFLMCISHQKFKYSQTRHGVAKFNLFRPQQPSTKQSRNRDLAWANV